MNTTVLLVDDEEAVLKGYERNIAGMFETEVAHNAQEALAKIKAKDKYALVISDHRMPGMTGIEMLREVRELRPDMVRMLITGYADLQMSLDAINEGSVFRMLTKPCSPNDFYKAIEDGLRQHELITSEKELLEQTLNGSVQALVDILSMLDSKAFGRSKQMALAAKHVAHEMKLENLWEVEIAATLSEIGRVTLPEEVAKKRIGISEVDEKELTMLSKLPEFSSQILAHIPRLGNISEAVLYQDKNFDGSGFPKDKISGEHIPVIARILRVLDDISIHMEKGVGLEDILRNFSEKTYKFDPEVLNAAKECAGRLQYILDPHKKRTQTAKREFVTLHQLKVGHMLLSNIETTSGVLIINSGNVISPATLQRIYNFSSVMSIKEPIEVTRYDA